MTEEFDANDRALDCCSDLDGYIETIQDEDGNDGTPSPAVDTIARHLQRAYNTGRAVKIASYEEQCTNEAKRADEWAQKGIAMQNEIGRLNRVLTELDRLRAKEPA